MPIDIWNSASALIDRSLHSFSGELATILVVTVDDVDDISTKLLKRSRQFKCDMRTSDSAIDNYLMPRNGTVDDSTASECYHDGQDSFTARIAIIVHLDERRAANVERNANDGHAVESRHIDDLGLASCSFDVNRIHVSRLARTCRSTTRIAVTMFRTRRAFWSSGSAYSS